MDRNRTARDLAAQPVISVKPSMPLRNAVELMLEHRTSHVVVIDPANKRPIGVLEPGHRRSPRLGPGVARSSRPRPRA